MCVRPDVCPHPRRTSSSPRATAITEPMPHLAADGLPQAADPLDSLSGTSSGQIFELTPTSAKRRRESFGWFSNLWARRARCLPTGRNSPISVEPNSTTEVFAGKNASELSSRANYARGMTKEEDVTPVRMVHARILMRIFHRSTTCMCKHRCAAAQ